MKTANSPPELGILENVRLELAVLTENKQKLEEILFKKI